MNFLRPGRFTGLVGDSKRLLADAEEMSLAFWGEQRDNAWAGKVNVEDIHINLKTPISKLREGPHQSLPPPPTNHDRPAARALPLTGGAIRPRPEAQST